MTTTADGRPDADRIEAERRRIRQAAHLLDDAFRIPGTDRRFGWDVIIGLVPGIGDATGLALATVVIGRAIMLGARGGTVARMVLNASFDAVFGSIPVIGWLFDAWFKANQRNVGLLESHVVDPEGTEALSRRSVRRTIVAAVVAVVVVSLALLALVVWVLTLVF